MHQLFRPMMPLIGLAVLVACSGSEPSPAAPHNAEYYKQHPEERATVMKACAQDQNTQNPLNCDSAATAQRTVNMEKDMGL